MRATRGHRRAFSQHNQTLTLLIFFFFLKTQRVIKLFAQTSSHSKSGKHLLWRQLTSRWQHKSKQRRKLKKRLSQSKRSTGFGDPPPLEKKKVLRHLRPPNKQQVRTHAFVFPYKHESGGELDFQRHWEQVSPQADLHSLSSASSLVEKSVEERGAYGRGRLFFLQF